MVQQYWSVMVVSRSDFMGLGLVSQRSRSQGSKVSVSLETSRPQDLKEWKKNPKRGIKSTQSAGRFPYPHSPSEKNDVFHVEKYSP